MQDMSKYKIKVHNVTGSGIVGEKTLNEGDIVTVGSELSQETADKFEALGWIEKIPDEAKTADKAKKPKSESPDEAKNSDK